MTSISWGPVQLMQPGITILIHAAICHKGVEGIVSFSYWHPMVALEEEYEAYLLPRVRWILGQD